MNDSQHEQVDLGLAELPVGSVQRQNPWFGQGD
jgi:hypothetical protein